MWIYYYTIYVFFCVSGTYQQLEELQQVPPRSYPYVADILSRDWCHGILITENYVLANARCVFGSTDNIKIYLGWYSYPEYQNPVNETDVQIYTQIEAITHPKYRVVKQFAMYQNDIALLKLPQAVSVTRGVRPAILPNPEEFNKLNLTGLYGTVFGWYPTEHLSAAKVQIRSHEQCRDLFGRNYSKDRNFCIKWPPGKRLCSHYSTPLELNGKLIGLLVDDPQNNVECVDFEYKFLNIMFYYDWIVANSDLEEYLKKLKEKSTLPSTASSFSPRTGTIKKKCKIDIELECRNKKEW